MRERHGDTAQEAAPLQHVHSVNVRGPVSMNPAFWRMDHSDREGTRWPGQFMRRHTDLASSLSSRKAGKFTDSEADQ